MVYPDRFYQSGEISTIVVHFLCLPKENEPKEKAPCPLSRPRRDALCFSKWTGAAELAALKQSSLFVRPFLRCSATGHGQRNYAPYRGLPEASYSAGRASLEYNKANKKKDSTKLLNPLRHMRRARRDSNSRYGVTGDTPSHPPFLQGVWMI